MRLVSPDAFGQKLLSGLPKPFADFLWNIGVLIAWVSLFFSFLGAVHDFGVLSEIVSRLSGYGQWLRDGLVQLRELVTRIVDGWRWLTGPFRDFLWGVFPWRFSDLQIDVLIAIAALVPSAVRLVVVQIFFRNTLLQINSARGLAAEQKKALGEAKAKLVNAAASGLSGAALAGVVSGLLVGPVGALLPALGAVVGARLTTKDSAEAIKLIEEQIVETERQIEILDKRLKVFEVRREQSIYLISASAVVAVFILSMVILDSFWQR